MTNIAVFLVNIGMWAGWVYLAVHFDKWWIALFGLFTLFGTGNNNEKE